MNKLRISLLQTDICWENKEYNLRRLHEKLEKLSGTTEIVVLPEMFSTGFSMNCHDLSEPVSGQPCNNFARGPTTTTLQLPGATLPANGILTAKPAITTEPFS